MAEPIVDLLEFVDVEDGKAAVGSTLGGGQHVFDEGQPRSP